MDEVRHSENRDGNLNQCLALCPHPGPSPHHCNSIDSHIALVHTEPAALPRQAYLTENKHRARALPSLVSRGLDLFRCWAASLFRTVSAFCLLVVAFSRAPNTHTLDLLCGIEIVGGSPRGWCEVWSILDMNDICVSILCHACFDVSPPHH